MRERGIIAVLFAAFAIPLLILEACGGPTSDPEAIGLLKKCIAKENTNPDYFLYMGVAQQKSGHFDLALTNYQEALKLDKSNALVYNNMGSVHLMYFLRSRDLNQYNQAVANFNNALAFNPFLQAAINGKDAAEKFKAQLEQSKSVKY